MALIALNKANSGEKVLVNPDQITYVEQTRQQDGSECANLYVANREMLKVVQTVDEIEGLLSGDIVFGQLELTSDEDGADEGAEPGGEASEPESGKGKGGKGKTPAPPETKPVEPTETK